MLGQAPARANSGRMTTVSYLGFRAGDSSRQYRLAVTGVDGSAAEVVVSIPNEAFTEKRLKYQDAPEICFLKLKHELAAAAGGPLASHFDVTNAELEEYRSAHAVKTSHKRPPTPPATPPPPAETP